MKLKRLLPVLVVVSFLCAAGLFRGQDTTAPTLSLTELLQKFNESQQAVQSLTATFTERKNLSLLAKPVVSNGTFLYSKPARIKWEYSSPAGKLKR